MKYKDQISQTEEQIRKLHKIRERLGKLKEPVSVREQRRSILEKMSPPTIVISPRKPERKVYDWIVSAYTKLRNNYVILGLGILSLFLSGLFFSNNFTGNSVLIIDQTFSNFVGGLLFAFGLIGIFFHFKGKK